MANVAVTNKGAEPYSKRFDGKIYEFPVGKAVVIADEVAAFLFGYGLTDAARARILVRNGWQQNGTPGDPRGPEAAQERLANFLFRAAPDDEPRPKPKKQIAPAQAGFTLNEPRRAADPQINQPQSGTLTLPHGRAPRAQPAA